MFWLPVKGLAQWRHTSFPVLSFLPLRRLYVFPRVHSLPRALGDAEPWLKKLGAQV